MRSRFQAWVDGDASTLTDEEIGRLLAADVIPLDAVLRRVDAVLRRVVAVLRRRSGGAGVVPAVAEPGPADPRAFGFPVFVDVRGRRVFVGGGGHEATRKAAALAELGADVLLWSAADGAATTSSGVAGVELVVGAYRAALLDGAFLAIAATGDRSLDRRIATDARARRVLVNTVDDVPLCDWTTPAILRRGGLTIAVGTGALAPALAVRLRDRIGAELGPEYGDLLDLLGDLRPRIAASGRPFGERRQLWYALVDGPALEHLRAGRRDAAREALVADLDRWLVER